MDPAREVNLTPEQQAQIAQIMNLPPGSALTIERFDSTQEASGKGATFSGRGGDKVVTEFDGTAPTASLPGVGDSSGGDTKIASEIAGIPFPYVSILFGVAAVACLGFAGWSAYKGATRGAVIAGILGAACVVVAVLPVFAAAIAGVAILGLVGFYVWTEVQNRQNREVARAAGEAITSPQLTDEARRQVIAAMRQAADPGDIQTLNKLNYRDGLPILNDEQPRV